MKVFKNLCFGLLSLVLLSATLPVFAQETKDLKQFLPESTDLVFEFDTNHDSIFNEYINNLLEQQLFPPELQMGQLQYYLTTEEQEQEKVFFEKLLNQSQIMFALDIDAAKETNRSPNVLLSFNITAADFSTLMDYIKAYVKSYYGGEENYGSDIDLVGESYHGAIIYKTPNAYVALVENKAVFTNDKVALQALIDNVTEPDKSMLTPSTYQLAHDQTLDSAFFNLFIRPQFVSNSNLPLPSGNDLLATFLNYLFGSYKDLTDETLNAINVDGLSFAQSQDGFDVNIYNETDAGYLKKNNLSPEKYEFIPSLYHHLSGEGLIFYSEQKNLTEALNDENKMYQEAHVNYFYSLGQQISLLGMNLDENIGSLLKGQSLIAVHQQNNVLPSLTILVDVEDYKTEAAQLLAKLNQSLRDEWSKNLNANGGNFYHYTIETVGQTAFYTHTIDLTPWMADSDYFNKLPKDYLTLKLQMAVTDEGLLVISTHSDLGKIFQLDANAVGLLSNADLAEAFVQQDDVVTGIVYVNLKSVKNYFVSLDEMFQQYMPKADGTSLQTMVTSLEPWKDIIFVSYADQNQTWTHGKVRVDLEQLKNDFDQLTILAKNMLSPYGNPSLDDLNNTVGDIITDATEPVTESTVNVSAGDIQFCDVSSSDWFYSYVHSLVLLGVVQGKNDGCFHPTDSVTRAEFAKMVMATFDAGQVMNNGNPQYKSSVYDATPWINAGSPSTFNDVTDADWYKQVVDRAYGAVMMKGYGDNTFRPYMPITRAEAAQILYNLDGRYALEFANYNEDPFADVNVEDWFYVAVKSLYNNKFFTVPETSNGEMAENPHFEPNRNITRAEAAKLIVYAMLEKQHHTKQLQVLIPVSIEQLINSSMSANGELTLSYKINKGAEEACENQKKLIDQYKILNLVEDQFDMTSTSMRFRSDVSEIILTCLQFQFDESTSPFTVVQLDQKLKKNYVDNLVPVDLDIKILDEAKDVLATEAMGNLVETYMVKQEPVQACKEQAQFVQEAGWSPSSVTPGLVISLDAASQLFEKDNFMLTLACAKNLTETDFTIVSLVQAPKITDDAQTQGTSAQ